LAPLRPFWQENNIQRLARRLIMELESPGNYVYHLLDRARLDDEAGQLINTIYRLRGSSAGKMFWLVPGVDRSLAALKDFYPLAVVSARGEKSTLAFLQQFDLLKHFSVVVTAQTCLYTKPFPDPVIHAANRMGVNPQECLMVGDTVVDIRAGKTAGAQTVGVLCGFGTEGELIKAGADLILPSPNELVDIIVPVRSGRDQDELFDGESQENS
jgi:phosphoglycolate phosphatase-like HAD superfamily hydrolase